MRKFPLKLPRGNLVLITGGRYVKTRFGRGILLLAAGCVLTILATSAVWPLHTNLQVRKLALEDEVAMLTKLRLQQEYRLQKRQDTFQELQAFQSELANYRSCILKVNPYLSESEIHAWIQEAWQSSKEIELTLNDDSVRRLTQATNSRSVPAGAALLLAVGAMESNFDTKARSDQGAVGGMQMMHVTARSLGIDDPLIPEHNLRGGRAYLIQMMKQFKGYEDQLELALAAYNAGPTRVMERWIPEWGVEWEAIYAGLSRQPKTFAETRYYTHSALTLAQLFTSGQWTWKNDIFWESFRSHLKRQTMQAYTTLANAATGG